MSIVVWMLVKCCCNYNCTTTIIQKIKVRRIPITVFAILLLLLLFLSNYVGLIDAQQQRYGRESNKSNKRTKNKNIRTLGTKNNFEKDIQRRFVTVEVQQQQQQHHHPGSTRGNAVAKHECTSLGITNVQFWIPDVNKPMVPPPSASNPLICNRTKFTIRVDVDCPNYVNYVVFTVLAPDGRKTYTSKDMIAPYFLFLDNKYNIYDSITNNEWYIDGLSGTYKVSVVAYRISRSAMKFRSHNAIAGPTTIISLPVAPCPENCNDWSQCIDCMLDVHCNEQRINNCYIGTCTDFGRCTYKGICDDNYNYPHCVNGECRQCIQTSDCASINPSTDSCRKVSCTDQGQCIDEPLCDEVSSYCVDGECIQCTADTDCASVNDGSWPFCVDNECRQCITDTDCPISNDQCIDVFCDNLGSCVSQPKCTGDSPYCVAGGCRQCMYTSQCTPSKDLCKRTYCNIFGSCVSATKCAGTSTPHCLKDTGECRQCVYNSHCTPSNDPCKVVSCSDTGHCIESDLSFFTSSDREEQQTNESSLSWHRSLSEEPTTSTNLQGKPQRNKQEPVTFHTSLSKEQKSCLRHRCKKVTCNTKGNCIEEPICDESLCAYGVCHQCIQDEHCNTGDLCHDPFCTTEGTCSTKPKCTGDTPFCVKGDCKQCTTTSNCIQSADPCTKVFCNDSGQCVEEPVCGDGKYCVASQCVDCIEDDHCHGGDACNNPVCLTGGTCSTEPKCSFESEFPYCVHGDCRQCTETSQCTPSSDSCSKSSCNNLGQCIELPLCDGHTPFCLNGECKECIEESDCSPPTDTCKNASCSAAGSCIEEPKCTGSTPYCSNGLCHQCFFHSQCSPPEDLCEKSTCTSLGDCVTKPKCSGDTPYCINGECQQCTDSSQCTPSSDPCKIVSCNEKGRCVESDLPLFGKSHHQKPSSATTTGRAQPYKPPYQNNKSQPKSAPNKSRPPIIAPIKTDNNVDITPPSDSSDNRQKLLCLQQKHHLAGPLALFNI